MLVIEERGKEYWEDLSNENLGQSLVQDNPQNPSSTSSNILTGGHLPIVVMGLVPFTHPNSMMWHVWKIFVLILK